ncbi:hypothetical protein [Streptomyces alkaliterrae]|uniref:hypothetical protein n=1 Tax=Streptomyces alkaliterrae TaxID=2213162 RepID=UPI002B20EE0B|nr:hypothetical protein [Streptomyces alkaliterrae]
MLADLGHVQLERGDTAQALATWRDFPDCAEGVRSVRINDGMTNIAARLQTLPLDPTAGELTERITART